MRLLENTPCHLPEDWIAQASTGGGVQAATLRRCLLRARQMFASFYLQCNDPSDSGVLALMKVRRSLAILAEDGRVRTAEKIRVADPDALFDLPVPSAAAKLSAAKWDDRATFFTDAGLDFSLSAQGSNLDGSAKTALRSVPDEIRFFEYFLNADPDRGHLSDILTDATPLGGVEGLTLDHHRKLNRDLRAILQTELELIAEAEVSAAYDQFRRRIDAGGMMRAMAAAGLNGCFWFNWTAGFDWESGTVNGRVALHRRQALSSLPLFHCYYGKTGHPAQEAVDEARPLIPALASSMGVSERTVRNMVEMGVGHVGMPTKPDERRLRKVAADVERLPPGPKPANETEWKVFFSALTAADTIAETCAPGCEESAMEIAGQLIRTAAGNWGTISLDAINQATGIMDVAADLLSMLVHPYLRVHNKPVNDWTISRMAHLLVSKRSLRQIVDAVAEWHASGADIRARLAASYPADETEELSWLGMTSSPFVASNGLLVVCLTDDDALAEEHKRMGHCVNTYAGRCMIDGYQVVSVRSPDGQESYSTAGFRLLDIEHITKDKGSHLDLDPIYDRLPPGVSQHQGVRNRTPNCAAKQALWEYVAAVATHAVKVNTEQLRSELEHRRSRERLAIADRYDPFAEGALRDAWENYKHLLPRKARKAGPNKLFA